ncbi:ribosomal protection tetracycline resistance protein [Thermostaphylospora chromogena]|uniref:Ribosomal protection tetracycline resistance protein n=1 Tax=Thermostaphylospora chromogena TaxID=35622 RepID=A0A1H1C828_9ACTN|nr:ribosomal protection tetracycline resistance protein [Thermostaphylospora chromogena]
MRTLNLGILAHVDAGKTSLTERLLHTAGVIDEPGSVDAGNTRTDTLELERRRGITIKAAVVSFPIDGVTVNLIDTPGHPDFIAEVERAFAVLDGAVLVVSAVEGVQPQTRVLMRTLQRLRIPTLIFVNKIDRRGADPERVLDEIAAKLTRSIVPMGRVVAPGTAKAAFETGDIEPDVLAEHDDALLAAYVAGVPLSRGRLRRALTRQSRRALVHPVYFGSALTGAGVAELTCGIARLLPAAAGDADGPLSGTVFKIERGRSDGKIAYVRLFSGTLRVRDRLADDARVTSISVFRDGSAVRSDRLVAGQIGRIGGLANARIGDHLGEPPANRGETRFAPPTLETVVEPVRAADRGALHAALTQLAEQDPLIDLRQGRDELYVSLYGEVQKEVIAATLADEYGVAVTFRESSTVYIERPVGTGAAVEFNGKGDNPFLATIGLRVDPAPPGSGVGYDLAVELGSMPYAFMKVVEDTVRETLQEGLYGWRVTDCRITLTHTGYSPKQSAMHAGFDKSISSTGYDFRGLVPLVLMEALRRAGTRVYEPVYRFHFETPPDTLGQVLPALAQLRAVPEVTEGGVTGLIPAAMVHRLHQALPTLTRGEGVLDTAFDHYRAVTGPPPVRRRTDHNPLDRKEYLLHVLRRV